MLSNSTLRRAATLSALLLASTATVHAGGSQDMERPGGAAVATPTAVRLEGTCEFFGVPGSFLLESRGSEGFHLAFGGSLPSTLAFDGTTLWERDDHGHVRELLLGEREVQLLLVALMDGSLDDGLLELEAPGARGVRRFRIRGGRLAGNLEPNALGGPRRVVTTTPGSEFEIDLVTDARGVLSRMKVVGPAGDESWTRVEGASELSADGVAAFERPAPDPERVTWSRGVAPSIPLKRTSTGHELVRARVDGQDLGWFVFDSGAGSSVLDLEAIEALGLESLGAGHVQGVGGAAKTEIVRAGSFQLGPFALRGMRFIGIELDFLDRAFGVPVAGIVGYDVLARARVLVERSQDERAGRLHLWPAGATPDDERKVLWHRCMTPGRVPVVHGRLEGRDGLFRLDTGAPETTLIVHAPAVERLGLLEGRPTRRNSVGGVGGRVPLRSGRIESFELLGRSWEDLRIDFATENEGAFSDAYTDGNVGGRLLEGFDVMFDLPRERIGLVARPRGEAGAR